MNAIHASIHIKDLRLRTFIGFNEEEKVKKQDVVINIMIQYNAESAMQSDDVSDAYNYKILTKKIIVLVENNRFNLLEKLANDVMRLITESDAVISAQVIIDKPHALRFADSVAIELNFSK